jgi:cytochrome oxidase assembly protein ShyY1
MSNNFQQTAENIDQITDFIVAQAMETASQVQQGAQQIQAQSQATPLQPPVQATTNVSGPFTSSGLFWFGLGAVAALGLSYYLTKRRGE